MRKNSLQVCLNAVVLAMAILLLPAGLCFAQTVSLTASRQTTTLPDGKTVPMWGLTCGTATGSATCKALNGSAQIGGTTWQPPLITIPTGSTLTINLTNNLVVPTSLTIIGQPGGGLGSPVKKASPAHAPETMTTWPIQTASTFTPPAQPPRAESFTPEAASGGGTQSYVWTSALKPGTYLIESGTHPSIQAPMGLYGVLVVTTAPAGATPGTAYPVAGSSGVRYDADAVMLLSEIDPVQNTSADTATRTAGFSETTKWTPACGPTGPAATANTCYPPAVDFTPLYYLVNGKSFDKTAPANTALAIPATATTGNVLLRFVNAGLHMHVPSVVGLNLSLIADDANVQPDVALALSKGLTPKPKVQSDVFLAAGKVYDVIVNPPATGGSYAPAVYPMFDRELSLSTNNARDGGMHAVLQVAGAALNVAGAVVNADTYMYVPGVSLVISDPTKGVIANDINVYGVTLKTAPAHAASFGLNADGTFTYTPNGTVADSFVYCANGSATLCTTATLSLAPVESAATIVANPDTYTSTVASLLKVGAPGVLANDVDGKGYPLKVALTGTGAYTTAGCKIPGTVVHADGSFTAIPSIPGSPCVITYHAQNSQNTLSNSTTATVNFPVGSKLSVTVQDAQTPAVKLTDYKWIIEQDLTFHVNPNGTQQVNTGAPAQILGTNFHASAMPVIATGCTGPQSCERGQTVFNPATGTHVPTACDGSGNCGPTDTTSGGLPESLPSDVVLNATNPDGTPASYFISILPGDAANAFNTGNVQAPTATCAAGTTPAGGFTVSQCGHTMGGAVIPAPVGGVFAPVTVNVEPNPIPTATVTVYVFEDDYPLNGEPDAGGGVDVLATQEPSLGDFQVIMWDEEAFAGDFTGQMTYDMFNEPLTNSLNGTIDPASGLNACPISPSPQVGVIIVCPKYESDGKTLSPLTGNAVVRNLMPGRFGVTVHPSAAREANGEQWYQTNTLDGSHFLDTFVRAGEPAYFQEFGPGGYHAFFGEANPAIINARLPVLCATAGTGPCNNTVSGQVTNLHESRPPNETLDDSAVYPLHDARNNMTLGHTTCYAALGDPDGATYAFTTCDPNGNFTFTGIPAGNWSLVVFDEWLDLIVDGTSKAINIPTSASGLTIPVDYAAFTWQTHIWSNTYMDLNGNGIQDPGEPGLLQVPNRIRMRNGRINNTLLSDITGNAHFNETFPLFNWYVAESDTTRFKATGVHVVNDSGGLNDGPAGTYGNGNLSTYQGMLNSQEPFPLPTQLRVPGAVYCATANCTDVNLSTNPTGGGPGGSGGRIDPGSVISEGLQSYLGQTEILDWGKLPYAVGENGGIRGHVVYASTRPFDDPQILSQNLWEPMVPRVTMNLYQEGTAPDGTPSLTLVDTTTTSSWDDWAQGFRTGSTLPALSSITVTNGGSGYTTPPAVTINGGNGATAVAILNGGSVTFIEITNAGTGGTGAVSVSIAAPPAGGTQATATATTGTLVPNMNCPGQDPTDPFFNYTLASTKAFLSPNTALPNNSQFKCYDGLHVFNQVQPAPYDGMYQFPSPTCAKTPGGTFTTTINGVVQTITCATKANPATSSPVAPAVLPTGKYVVEVITPTGFEIVKEEDKNILIGDAFIAPASLQFGAMTNIWIVPDQASLNAYNAAYGTGGGSTNPTTYMGNTTFSGFNAGGILTMNAPCVGAMRVVPDFMSISPESGEVAPFAGATRPLCDRKELILDDQMQAQTDFFVWTKTPASAHFTGFILDDFSSEYNTASPTFGEKFAVPVIPISIKDYNGVEVSRLYSDQWGIFNGLTYSSWEVNPPNPTGYAPNMMITCMNDPGPILDPAGSGKMVTDPQYNPMFSNFCYENPFMPYDTTYLDTPVVPVAAFAEGYNPPDCAYPDATPAISEVDGDGIGPWVSKTGARKITITALGNVIVPNHAYSGPAASTAPYNQRTITRHYGFGTTPGTVTVGGVALTNVSWSDLTITGTVPTTVPSCKMQQSGAGNGGALCGELSITAANGRQSIDTVTVTVGGKAPTHVPATSTIQSFIDAATPGDLIIVDPAIQASGGAPASPATHVEFLLMWKPIRLQGVGAVSSVVNSNTHPAGKVLDPWRRQITCLFGLALNGIGINNTIVNGSPVNPYDPTGTYTCTNAMNNAVDPIPQEAIVGWDATGNGNLAEMLQEPTLMGAYEGAGVTVLGKGVSNYVAGDSGAAPILLTNSSSDCRTYPSNFLCNPSRIDGLTFTNSSQGGGGILLHGWNHNLEISNNRVFANAGTLTGGITIGQVQVTDGTIAANGQEEAYGYNTNVNVHNNSVTGNTSFGDELNSNTPSSSGGVTFCAGADYYAFNYNWVCGNMSTGDGGGFAHLGFIYNGQIEHNSFLFNQSFNSTLTTYGGGVVIEGQGPDGLACENATGGAAATDQDCPPALSDGIGPGLVFNANLVQGNTAESGSGGGLRLQSVNGADVQNNPTNPANWYQVNITNNIFVNNVAGWAGGGVSLEDAINVNFINNTVVSNDTTASAGVLFDTIGAPNANVPPPGCDPTTGIGCTNPITTSNFQPSGFETELNSILLTAVMPTSGLRCPSGHPNCNVFSNPVLDNNVIYQNRAFHICVGGCNTIAGESNVITLTPVLSQTVTGQCPTTGFGGGTGPMYWDIGIYGDAAPGKPASPTAPALNPLYSVIADPGWAGTNGNLSPTAAGLVSQYCNGSRIPPEIAPTVCTNGANAPGCTGGGAGGGGAVSVGVPDVNPFYPVFSLNPAATTDEGNNFINMFYGPLSLSNATIASSAAGYNVPLGNYAPATATSPEVGAIPHGASTYALAPTTDFFGNKRPRVANGPIDIGAVVYEGITGAVASVSPTSLAFGNVVINTTSTNLTLTLSNTGGAALTTINVVVTAPFARNGGTCATTLAAATTCTILVDFHPTTATASTGTVTITASVPVTGSPVSLTGTGVAPTTSATLTPATYTFPTTTRGAGILGPVRFFTFTNTGTATVTGIGQAVLGGTNAADYTIVRGVSTCGPTGNGQTVANTTLAPGASCVVEVQFRPLTADPVGSVRSGSVSVTATTIGTLTSTFTGTTK
jgi:hypothetical protein